MKHIIDSYLSFFTAHSLHHNKQDIVSRKMLILVLSCIWIILFFYTLFFIMNGVITKPKAIYNYIGLSGITICLFTLRKIKNHKIILQIFSLFGFVMIGISTFLSGGIYSSDIYWCIVCVSSAFLFIDEKFGIITAIISVVLISAFYYLESIQFKDFEIDSVAISLLYRYVNTIFILIITSLIFYILLAGNKKLSKVIQELKEKKLREEIATDFHDNIGNRLASIKHLSHLSKISSEENQKKEILNMLESQSKDVYDNFRDFVWSQDPQSDYTDELYMYLRDYIDDYLKVSEIELEIHTIPETIPSIKLASYDSRELVPAVKELVTNILKHSKAQKVFFTFELSEQNLLIKIQDNGIGFASKENLKGKGIGNLNKRMERIGGKLEISSHPKGTIALLSVNLPKQGSSL